MADSKLSTTTGSLNSRESRDSPNIKCDGGGSKNKNLDNGHKGGTPKKRKMNHSHQPMAQNSSANSGYNSNFNGQQHQGHRLTGSPAWDLPPQNSSSQTFTGRCRLFVANLPQSVTEESLRKLFAEFGQIADIYIGKGNQFAFVKMDTRNNAEAAKNNLDGYNLEGRTLRVRLAAHAAAVKVTNLPPCVTNELLFFTFSTFGPIERAIVVADDRGRSLNEGIVEFVRKSSAQAAIKKCQNECLLLSATPIPAVVTSLESRDEEEGVPEKNISHTLEYRKEREIGPRFAEIGTVEYEISKKWKNLAQIEAQRREAFEAEMKDMHENFQTQMEYFKLEESTKQLREQLRQMESQAQQMNAGRDARFEYERQREEQRRQHENMLRAQEEQLIGPPASQPDMNTLRRQESDLRQQANALQQLLDRQESALRQMNPHVDSGHMDSNMYGQGSMGPGQHPGAMMGPGQMAAPPPNPMSYPPQSAPPMHPQPHPQMVPHPHQMQPSPVHRPMAPYNGGPPNHPPPPPQSYSAGPVPRVQNHQMNHLPNNNYGKRNRQRY